VKLLRASSSEANAAKTCLEQCAPARCRPGCSLEVVAELLSQPGAVAGDEADSLLDLHQLLKHRREAEAALRLFCDLRRRLEQRHYLAFYRLRRWLENHIVAEIFVEGRSDPVQICLRLNFYCVEAVRRLCLCELLRSGGPSGRSRLRFAFKPLAAEKESAGFLAGAQLTA